MLRILSLRFPGIPKKRLFSSHTFQRRPKEAPNPVISLPSSSPAIRGLFCSAVRLEGGEVREPPLPSYVPRVGESVEVKRARLLYQSRKRGMLENGLLLSTFASAHLKGLTSPQLDLYDDIINRPSNDWELYYWMTGKEETPADYDNEVMDMLKVHARNENCEARYRQPDL